MEDKRYIVIFEDGEPKFAKKIAQCDLDACDDGLLTIIDISNPSQPLTYYNGVWEELTEV